VDRRYDLTTAAVLEGIKGHGAQVWTEGDKLRYSGPKDVLDPEVLGWLREHKQEVITLLAPVVPEDPSITEDANELTRFVQRKLDKAQRLGLVARWSQTFGYVSLHDPTTGEWHDLQTKEAPDWAVREARKRKEFYNVGNHKAYRLTAQGMEEIWEAERAEMWEHPAVMDKGIVYEDYLEEDA
jgi:hypothetical protein